MIKNAALRKRCDARLTALRDRRFTIHSRWTELSAFIDPKRGSFDVKAAGTRSKQAAKDGKVKDSTARDALRTLQSGLMSGATSAARPWFRCTLDDGQLADVPENKIWLAEVQKRMLRVFAESNTYTTLHNLYGDLGLFGIAGFLVLEDFEDVIRCYPLVVGEFYIALDHRLVVNTLYREFVMTVGQMAEEFGKENLSADALRCYNDGKFDQEFDVVHAVEPNDDIKIGMKDASGMAFRDVYYQAGGNTDGHFLRVSGFHEFPAMIPRWDVNGNDAYGSSSPGMDSLPDVKQLMSETLWKGQAIGKGVNPPMTAPVSMKNQPATAVPGGITYVADQDGKQGFKPAYQPTTNLSHLKEDIEGVKAAVRRAFYADLFMAISQMEGVQPRNNLEILERKDEKLVQLGPVLERLHGELLSRLIDRTYSIMDRAGLLPEKPQTMGEGRPKIEFVSVLAQAQKSVGTAGIERFMAFLGSLYEVFPEAKDKAEIDEILDEYADLLGLDPKFVRATAAAIKMRAERAKQEQTAQAIANAPQLAGAGKTLSETDVGGGISALQQMTGAA